MKMLCIFLFVFFSFLLINPTVHVDAVHGFQSPLLAPINRIEMTSEELIDLDNDYQEVDRSFRCPRYYDHKHLLRDKLEKIIADIVHKRIQKEEGWRTLAKLLIPLSWQKRQKVLLAYCRHVIDRTMEMTDMSRCYNRIFSDTNADLKKLRSREIIKIDFFQNYTPTAQMIEMLTKERPFAIAELLFKSFEDEKIVDFTQLYDFLFAHSKLEIAKAIAYYEKFKVHPKFTNLQSRSTQRAFTSTASTLETHLLLKMEHEAEKWKHSVYFVLISRIRAIFNEINAEDRDIEKLSNDIWDACNDLGCDKCGHKVSPMNINLVNAKLMELLRLFEYKSASANEFAKKFQQNCYKYLDYQQMDPDLPILSNKDNHFLKTDCSTGECPMPNTKSYSYYSHNGPTQPRKKREGIFSKWFGSKKQPASPTKTAQPKPPKTTTSARAVPSQSKGTQSNKYTTVNRSLAHNQQSTIQQPIKVVEPIKSGGGILHKIRSGNSNGRDGKMMPNGTTNIFTFFADGQKPVIEPRGRDTFEIVRMLKIAGLWSFMEAPKGASEEGQYSDLTELVKIFANINFNTNIRAATNFVVSRTGIDMNKILKLYGGINRIDRDTKNGTKTKFADEIFGQTYRSVLQSIEGGDHHYYRNSDKQCYLNTEQEFAYERTLMHFEFQLKKFEKLRLIAEFILRKIFEKGQQINELTFACQQRSATLESIRKYFYMNEAFNGRAVDRERIMQNWYNEMAAFDPSGLCVQSVIAEEISHANEAIGQLIGHSQFYKEERGNGTERADRFYRYNWQVEIHKRITMLVENCKSLQQTFGSVDYWQTQLRIKTHSRDESFLFYPKMASPNGNVDINKVQTDVSHFELPYRVETITKPLKNQHKPGAVLSTPPMFKEQSHFDTIPIGIPYLANSEKKLSENKKSREEYGTGQQGIKTKKSSEEDSYSTAETIHTSSSSSSSSSEDGSEANEFNKGKDKKKKKSNKMDKKNKNKNVNAGDSKNETVKFMPGVGIGGLKDEQLRFNIGATSRPTNKAVRPPTQRRVTSSKPHQQEILAPTTTTRAFATVEADAIDEQQCVKFARSLLDQKLENKIQQWRTWDPRSECDDIIVRELNSAAKSKCNYELNMAPDTSKLKDASRMCEQIKQLSLFVQWDDNYPGGGNYVTKDGRTLATGRMEWIIRVEPIISEMKNKYDQNIFAKPVSKNRSIKIFLSNIRSVPTGYLTPGKLHDVLLENGIKDSAIPSALQALELSTEAEMHKICKGVNLIMKLVNDNSQQNRSDNVLKKIRLLEYPQRQCEHYHRERIYKIARPNNPLNALKMLWEFIQKLRRQGEYLGLNNTPAGMCTDFLSYKELVKILNGTFSYSPSYMANPKREHCLIAIADNLEATFDILAKKWTIDTSLITAQQQQFVSKIIPPNPSHKSYSELKGGSRLIKAQIEKPNEAFLNFQKPDKHDNLERNSLTGFSSGKCNQPDVSFLCNEVRENKWCGFVDGTNAYAKLRILENIIQHLQYFLNHMETKFIILKSDVELVNLHRKYFDGNLKGRNIPERMDGDCLVKLMELIKRKERQICAFITTESRVNGNVVSKKELEDLCSRKILL